MSLKWIKTSEREPKIGEIVIGKYIDRVRTDKTIIDIISIVWRIGNYNNGWHGIVDPITTELPHKKVIEFYSEPEFWIPMNELMNIKDAKVIINKSLVSRYQLMDID